MEQASTSSDRIIHAVAESPGCLLDELVSACSGLTWNQVFLAVDRLSRTGRVQLTRAGVGKYAVRLSSHTRQRIGSASSVRQQSLEGNIHHDCRG